MKILNYLFHIDIHISFFLLLGSNPIISFRLLVICYPHKIVANRLASRSQYILSAISTIHSPLIPKYTSLNIRFPHRYTFGHPTDFFSMVYLFILRKCQGFDYVKSAVTDNLPIDANFGDAAQLL